VTDVIVAVLLALGVAAVLLSCTGLLVMRAPLDRLHFSAPSSTIGPVLIAAAVLVEEPLSSAGIKAVMVAIVIVVTTPILSHATARATRIRAHGRWAPLDERRERDEEWL
jgi:monovalent cation/proton antiporter MnhG/PhaG subunit